MHSSFTAQGHPNPILLPLDGVNQAFQKRAAKEGAAVDMMQYGRMRGPEILCQSISDWMTSSCDRTANMPRPENIIITNGSSHGLSLASQLFSRPGQLVFVDSPGYFLSYFTFADCGLTVVNIPTDEHGMKTDAVEQMLQQGKVPSLLYTVPIGNNPTGVAMSESRKKELVRLARQYNFKLRTCLSFPIDEKKKKKNCSTPIKSAIDVFQSDTDNPFSSLAQFPTKFINSYTLVTISPPASSNSMTHHRLV